MITTENKFVKDKVSYKVSHNVINSTINCLPKSTTKLWFSFTTPAHQNWLLWSTGYPGPNELVEALNFAFGLFLMSETQAES